MGVSKSRSCYLGPEQEAAFSWLQRQLAWEQTLDRLRRAAGVALARAVAEPDGAPPVRPAA